MKLPPSSIFLAFVLTLVPLLIGAAQDDPPQVCAYDTHTCRDGEDGWCYCADLGLDDAICGNGDGGWKFGINAEGTYGLWKPNGKLLRLLGQKLDWLWMEVDDCTWVEATPYDDDMEGSWSIGNVWCENYEGGPLMIVGGGARKEPGVADDVVFRYGADPPYEQIMTINRKGEIRLDPKCHLRGILSAPPKSCKNIRIMTDSDDPLVRDEAICGRKAKDDYRYPGWRFGINSVGTLGLWKPNGELVKAYASYQDSFAVGENFIKSTFEGSDEGVTPKPEFSLSCLGEASSGTKLTLKPGRDPLIQLETRDSSEESVLATIDRLGNIEDISSCYLNLAMELVW